MVFLISPKVKLDEYVPDLFYLQVHGKQFLLFKRNKLIREVRSNELKGLNIVPAIHVKELEVLALWK